MKFLKGGAALAAACSILYGCTAMQQISFDSSGVAGGDAPETMLALSVHPEFLPDETDATTEELADIESFVGAFAQHFSADFPARLEERGVQSRDPGRGIPLLRIRASASRRNCHNNGQQYCDTEVRIDGALLDSSGARVWWFSEWVTPGQMNPRSYDAFYKNLLDRMVKDQAIASG
jgi:hypothetical protein